MTHIDTHIDTHVDTQTHAHTLQSKLIYRYLLHSSASQANCCSRCIRSKAINGVVHKWKQHTYTRTKRQS
jgi:hypothetical protein